MRRKSGRLARPPTFFGFTNDIDGTEQLNDVDSQHQQTGLTQPMQNLTITDSSQHYPKQKNDSTELLDIIIYTVV